MPGVPRIKPKRPIHVYLAEWREYFKPLTQKQLGERLGVDAVTYGRWERGEVGVSLDVLQAIAEALSGDLNYEDLTHFPPEKKSKPKTVIERLFENIEEEPPEVIEALERRLKAARRKA